MSNDKLKQANVDTTKSQAEDDTPQMPHERDESPKSQVTAPRKIMEQAHRDIESGQVDTDLRGTRGIESVKKPIPGPGQESAGEKFGAPESIKHTAD